MPISALPAVPSRDDPANFANEADAFLGALPTFVTEANALQTDVNSKQTMAATSEANALASALDAELSANEAAVSAVASSNASSAPKWVSGTNYAEGECTWSPSTFLTYRTKIAIINSTVDPADSTSWQVLNSEMAKFVTSSLAFTALHNWHYILTGVGDVNVTLPPSPANYMRVRITVANGRDTNYVLPNGSSIMNLPESCRLDNKYITVTFEFLNNTWRIV